ncbi:gamma-glutamylcyclotransferase family protein [Orrella marina]|uniref:Putative gamma-glutamylcyclotransferase n=1 Tax=Orrella marina TaxID=2163011 RepID=A0A2R4XFH2_9BURK|nr:gamma-glutamylcyclotransferase family protein [Orrella marina]AWB32545.1 hypothetical protein DBV39_01110 [Orrella marina]
MIASASIVCIGTGVEPVQVACVSPIDDGVAVSLSDLLPDSLSDFLVVFIEFVQYPELSPTVMSHNVFAYGSLMFPGVMQDLLGHPVQGHAVTLAGWSRHALSFRVYPGAVPAMSTSQIEGVVWQDLSDEDLRILDGFEGDEYLRCQVSLELPAGDTVKAWIYQWKDISLLLGNWDVQRFAANELETFVDVHRGS